MRISMSTERLLPPRPAVVAAAWLAAVVMLATIMPSPLAGLAAGSTALALTYAWRRFATGRDATSRRAGRVIVGDIDIEHACAQHFVAKEFAAARRGRNLTLVMFGLTRLEEFTEQNEAGAVGEALREFGRVLQQMTREMNLSSRCGWRADAFLSVLADADAAAANKFIERVRAAIAASAVPMPNVEAGIAVYQPHMASPEEFVQCAEHALAAARAAAGAERPRRAVHARGDGNRQLQTG